MAQSNFAAIPRMEGLWSRISRNDATDICEASPAMYTVASDIALREVAIATPPIIPSTPTNMTAAPVPSAECSVIATSPEWGKIMSSFLSPTR